MDKIDAFKGNCFFLSNFYVKPFRWMGKEWPSAEHAFQAYKFLETETQEKIRSAPTPGAARKLGKYSAPLRLDWEIVRVAIMGDILKAKFRGPDLQQALLETGDLHLEEGNTWGDTFWGTVNGKGENHLGKLLMETREELKS